MGASLLALAKSIYYILFLKLPCSRLLYLLNEKKKSKPNKTNQQETIEYEDTYPTVYESYMA